MNVILLAGLSEAVIDRVRSESVRRFVPNGTLIYKPLKGGSYTHAYSEALVRAAYEYLSKLPESQPVSIGLVYVDFQCSETENFLRNFFPYALPLGLKRIELNHSNKFEFRTGLNIYLAYLETEIRRLQKVSALTKRHIDVRNLTPLLLPLRNFDCSSLSEMLRTIFFGLSQTDEAEKLLAEAISCFLAKRPFARAPGSDHRCFSDGARYFKSPGRHRHGFFRNAAAANHPMWCLLNSRSRLGSTYDFTFHYDCEPVKGKLAASYPNCHDTMTPPKSTYVNVAPNDYIF